MSPSTHDLSWPFSMLMAFKGKVSWKPTMKMSGNGTWEGGQMMSSKLMYVVRELPARFHVHSPNVYLEPAWVKVAARCSGCGTVGLMGDTTRSSMPDLECRPNKRSSASTANESPNYLHVLWYLYNVGCTFCIRFPSHLKLRTWPFSAHISHSALTIVELCCLTPSGVVSLSTPDYVSLDIMFLKTAKL